MRIDPTAEARRLLGEIDPDFLPDLASDPFTAVEVLFDITVVSRRPARAGSGCAIDGTYAPGQPPRIEVADDVTPARQRFTVLHELGHHLIECDAHLNDLDRDISDEERRDEEICNEVAASILIPDALVNESLPPGKFSAEDVATLHTRAGQASRAACCVAAARRLRSSGCVILGSRDGTADFVAHHPGTPWRIARGTPQGEDSMLVRAGRSIDGRARGVTQVRFASGGSSGNVHGDAFVAADGWIYEVVVVDSHSPWETGLSFGISDTGAEPEQIECPRCGGVSYVWKAPCRRCGDRECPRCRRCSCESGTPLQRCSSCDLMKPSNQFAGGRSTCVDCE